MILEAIIAISCVIVLILLSVLVFCALMAVLGSARWDEEREAAWREYLEEKGESNE